MAQAGDCHMPPPGPRQNDDPFQDPQHPGAPTGYGMQPPPQQSSYLNQLPGPQPHYGDPSQGPKGDGSGGESYGYSMQPPPQYAVPYQQNSYGGGGGSGGMVMMAGPGYEGKRFQPEKPKWNDVWAAILFAAQLAGFIVLTIITLRAWNVSGTLDPDGNTLNYRTGILLLVVCGAALVLSLLYLVVVRFFTTFVLELTLALSVLFNIAVAVFYWVEHRTYFAVIFTIFAVFSVLAYFFMRKRIPLSKLLLITVIGAANDYKSSYLVSIVGLIVATAFSVLFSFTLVAIFQSYSPTGSVCKNHHESGCSTGKVAGLVVYAFFSFYWTSEVIRNITFATTAGIFGTWYYAAAGAPLPTHPAWGAFKRSMTYSFGSICFGSLIVAILDLIRALLRVFQQQQTSDGDIAGAILACVAGCCISCIDGLVEYFNRYAYINIALYGNSYITAAKETWRLLMDRGLTALINDSLVNIVWVMGSYLVGLICAVFSYVYLKKTWPQDTAEPAAHYFAPAMIFAFAIGMNICLSLGSGTIGGGVSTLFVALAEDPHVLAQKNPPLFDMIQSKYPQVLQPVA